MLHVVKASENRIKILECRDVSAKNHRNNCKMRHSDNDGDDGNFHSNTCIVNMTTPCSNNTFVHLLFSYSHCYI